MFNWLGSNVGRGDVLIGGTIKYAQRTSSAVTTFQDKQVPGNTNTYHAPTFIIWRLTYNGAEYFVDLGFPKFSRNMADGTGNSNWNQPQNWTTYNSW